MIEFQWFGVQMNEIRLGQCFSGLVALHAEVLYLTDLCLSWAISDSIDAKEHDFAGTRSEKKSRDHVKVPESTPTLAPHSNDHLLQPKGSMRGTLTLHWHHACIWRGMKILKTPDIIKNLFMAVLKQFVLHDRQCRLLEDLNVLR